jgi:hypothetical protein
MAKIISVDLKYRVLLQLLWTYGRVRRNRLDDPLTLTNHHAHVTCLKVIGLLIAGVAVGLVLHALHFRSPITFSEGSTATGEKRPFEFLYLDSGRVEAYLAQLEGGTFARQRLSHKLLQTASGEVTVPNAAKAGVSTQDESFVEREVTATAASRYIELLHELKSGEIDTIDHMYDFQDEVRCKLDEGDFVTFRTRSLRPPIYLNPYLAVSQAGTLSALFPMPSRNVAQRQVVKARRKASRQFRKQVGENPRVVFAIQPSVDHELGSVKYLLPMTVAQLTDERSLIKYGGGSFTVMGKVVRVFPQRRGCSGEEAAPGSGERSEAPPSETESKAERQLHGEAQREREEHLAYVDSPTRETWEHPLEQANGELICRTSPVCAKKVRKQGLLGKKRRDLIEAARTEVVEKMRAQTRIRRTGAVIIPVAIYK